MNSFPDDDPCLTAFLKQHQPPVPPAIPDLEDRLIAEIESIPPRLAVVPLQRRSRRLIWAVPPAIAAGLIATFVSYRSFTPAPPSEAEFADMQAFIESTWHDPASAQATAVHTDDELFSLPDETTVN